MNKEEEKRMLKIHLRTFKRRCNMILNQLDLIKRNMGALDLLEELDIDEEVKSGLISDLKSYDKRIREMKEELDNLTDEDLDDINEEDKEEEEVKELDDLVGTLRE